MTVNAQREAIARKIAAWIGYGWDGLPDYSVVNRSYPEWHSARRYQGGKPDLLRLADALMAHPRPELGREITDEMIERGARAHCPFAFEGEGDENYLALLRAEASKEVREILTAALSVTRPEGGRLTFCEECNANRVHVRTKIIEGVQMFECPVCAVASHNTQKAQP